MKDKPTIIRLRTTIGYGSKHQGTHGIHGTRKFGVYHAANFFKRIWLAALKPDDTEQLKAKLGFDPKATFQVSQKAYDAYSNIAKRGAKLEQEWNSLFSSYGQKYPKEYAELSRRIRGDLPDGWEMTLPNYKPSDPATASRKLSELVLTAISPYLPDLMGECFISYH